MPALSPRAVAFDGGTTYVLAYHGKDRHLLILDGTALRSVRQLPGTVAGTFWVAPGDDGPCAIFAKVGATVVVPLDPPTAKAKTLKLDGRAFFDLSLVLAPPSPVVHGVLGKALYRWDVDHWTCADGSMSMATALWSTVRGVYRRQVASTPADWRPLIEQQVVRPVIAITDDGKRVFAGGHGGTQQLIDPDGGNELDLPLPSTWDAVGLADRFVIWCERKVSELALDGTRTDTGITGEPHQDNCLFRAGGDVYFVETTRLHRRAPDGVWSVLDLKAMGAAIGLG